MVYRITINVSFLSILKYYIGAVAASGSYTEGLLSFGITDIHCNGTEQNISLCAQNEAQLHNCQSHDDAGVVCQGIDLLYSGKFSLVQTFALSPVSPPEEISWF